MGWFFADIIYLYIYSPLPIPPYLSQQSSSSSFINHPSLRFHCFLANFVFDLVSKNNESTRRRNAREIFLHEIPFFDRCGKWIPLSGSSSMFGYKRTSTAGVHQMRLLHHYSKIIVIIVIVVVVVGHLKSLHPQKSKMIRDHPTDGRTGGRTDGHDLI